MFNFSLLEWILVAALGFFFLIQLFYYFGIFSRLIFVKNKKITNTTEPVSIVICARNEAENLENNLPLVCEQEYPNFEVIVVNDCSEDETENVLKRLCTKYSNLRYTYIKEDEKFRHGKKLALTVGIKSAKNEWLLMTDADCIPAGNLWLAGMAQHFDTKSSIVLGYGGILPGKGFLNQLIRFDTAFIAMQYLSFAMFGKPYMGVGRNMAYRKSLFFKNKGFASHAQLLSGDDDLFVNETANQENTTVEFQPTSHTKTPAKKTFKDWVDQKQRHYTTFHRYKLNHKILLGTEQLSRYMFYIVVGVSLSHNLIWKYAIGLLIFRWIVQLFVIGNVLIKLNEKKILLISLLYDIIMPMVNFGILIKNLFRPKTRWR